ncbi:MAG TPA: hypothetical protein PKB02_14645 [Anaerohalosphaeraceae bacterium]|nr:hypothetical protein [Anaerohalosphaeraceae bacterium]
MIKLIFKLLSGFTVLILLLSFFSNDILDRVIFIEHFIVTILLFLQIINIFRINKIKSDPIRKKKAQLFAIFTVLYFVHYTSLYIVIDYKARAEIRYLLSQVNMEQTIVRLNGIEVTEKEKEDIVANLKQIKSLALERPGSCNKTKCEIVYDGQIMNLIIKQNSTDRDMFWISYPKYRVTSRNSIGGFYSDTLNLRNYKAKE